jgi:uncharacterized delta-60 repeat protein
MALQNDGKILLGGNFNTPDGSASLVRLNADGSLDTSFSGDHVPILYPKALLAQPDGTIFAAGVADSSGKGFVRRLNANGSVDPSFNAPPFDGCVEAIALDSEGGVIVGGSFSGKIARLNSDGTADPNWTITCDGTVKTIAIDNDGDILIGGAFSKVGEAQHRGIARLHADAKNNTTLAATNVNGRFTAYLAAETGKTYDVEASTDFRNWTRLTTAVASTAGVEISDVEATSRAHRFFRLKSVE